MRIDKYSWCVRLFKTRSLSAKACTAEKVKLNGEFVKPGKLIAAGDEISVKTNPIWRTYKIIDIPKSRVSAKLVSQYLIETTPESDILQLKQVELQNRQNKLLGIKGRPTKKDRRDLDQLKN